MSAVDKSSKKKRIFISSSFSELPPLRDALRDLNAEAFTLDQVASPGASWLDSLRKCIEQADVVLGVLGKDEGEPNVSFELGYATALNKPRLLFITQNFPTDRLPSIVVPYLRIDLSNEEALKFGLREVDPIGWAPNKVE